MKTILTIFTRPWIYILLIAIGIGFKFYKLDYKMMWYDEIATVLQIQGADSPFDVDSTQLNTIVPISQFKDILVYSDNPTYTFSHEIKAQVKNMNLNPLHYMLLSIWYRIFGESLVWYRLFSVFIFLLTLPFIYGIAKELFRSHIAGLIAVALFSLSPFIHYFAQELRYYMLWAFLLTVIHYFLLKAVLYNKNKWWIGYGICTLLSLYASTLSGFIIFEHILFVFIFKKELRMRLLIVLAIVCFLYAPWFWYVYLNKEEVYQSLSWHKFEGLPLWAPLLGLVLGLVRTFSFYLNYTLFWDDVFNNITPAMIFETVWNICILAFLVLSLIRLVRQESRLTAGFILLIIVPGLLFFWGLDIARNAITTHWWRYYIFNTIPVVLIAAYGIYSYIRKSTIITAIACISISAISIYSMYTIAQEKYWYLGGDWEQEFVDNSHTLDVSSKALVITDCVRLQNPWCGPMHTMEVLVNCASDSIDVLRISTKKQHITTMIPSQTYSDIYVMYASDELLENLKTQFGDTLQMIERKQGPPLWRIVSK